MHPVVRLALAGLIASLGSVEAETTPGTALDVKVTRQGEEVIVDCDMHTDVSQEEAWAVLTDFDHMARFVPNVQESTIIEKKGEQLRVHQKGRARYGLLSFGFESVRDIELKPISEIRSKAISGNVKSMNGVTRLSQDGHGSTHITFHSVSVPGVWIPPGVGIAFIKNEISEQFQGMLTEMKRRQPPSMTEQKQAHQKFSHDFEKNS